MAVRLSALLTRSTPPPRNIIIFMFLVLISVRGSVNPIFTLKECSERRLIGCARSHRECLYWHIVGSPGKLKVIRWVITRCSKSVIVTPSTVTEAPFCCALFCVFMAHARYSLEQRFFVISQHNMSVWRYNFQISEESSTHGILIYKSR
jgi:hypothetical protein